MQIEVFIKSLKVNTCSKAGEEVGNIKKNNILHFLNNEKL